MSHFSGRPFFFAANYRIRKIFRYIKKRTRQNMQQNMQLNCRKVGNIYIFCMTNKQRSIFIITNNIDGAIGRFTDSCG